MATRDLDFVDGFQSSAAPTAGIIQTTQLKSFADDAAFVTDKGSAAADGDIYLNSTSNRVRVHINSTWVNVLDDSTIENSIANNQASATSLSGLGFDGDDEISVQLEFQIERTTDSVDLFSNGDLWLQFTAGAWRVERQSTVGDDDGVTFSMDNQAGNVGNLQYTSTNVAGGSYAGTLKVRTKRFFS